MAITEWQPGFSFGIPEIDAQHRQLFNLINELHDAMLQGNAADVQFGTITELVRYTQTHFDAEEAIMQAVGFPGLAKHRRQHLKLAEEVINLQRNLDAGNEILSIDLMNFLRDWLQNHIVKEDAQYALWVRHKRTA